MWRRGGIPTILLAALLAAGCGRGGGEPAGTGQEPPGAGEAADAAEDIFPGVTSPREAFRRGMALYQEGSYNQAALAFQQASRLREGFVDAHYYAGKSLLKGFPSDLSGAETEFLKVIELAPSHLDARIALAQAYHLWGRNEEAAALLAEARRLSPGHRGILYSSGTVASRLGRHEEAVGFLREALKVDPRHVASLLELGQALTHLGRYEEALDAFRRVVALEPYNTTALMGVGTSLKRMGREEEARQALLHFQKVQRRLEGEEMHDKRVDVRFRQVQEAYRARNTEEARKAAELMRQEFPRATQELMNLGALHAQMGDLEEALKTYLQILDANDSNVTAAYRAAEIYRRMGDQAKFQEWSARYEELARKVRESRGR